MPSRAALQPDKGRRAPQAYLAARSLFAVERLEARHPAIARAIKVSRYPRWLLVIPGVAFILGIVSNELDGGSRLELLAFPLLGIIAWNIAVYLGMLVAPFARLGRAKDTADAPPRRRWWQLVGNPIAALGGGGASGLTRDVLGDFARDWARASGSLYASRTSAMLHLSAALFAIGLVAGIFLRALTVEYRAGWESTFLGAAEVEALLSFLLGPAAALTGIAIPGESGIAALRWTAAGGEPGVGANAGPWIILWTATVIGIVAIPRLVFAGWQAVSANVAARRVKVPGRDDFYVRRLLRAVGKGGSSEGGIRVTPYAYTPDETARISLQTVLRDVIGEGANVTIDPPCPYGAEEDWLAHIPPDEDADLHIVLFSLSATPEAENHATFVRLLREFYASASQGVRVAALVDEATVPRAFCRASRSRSQDRGSAGKLAHDDGRGEHRDGSPRARRTCLARSDRDAGACAARAGEALMATAPLPEAAGTTVNLSLISHTNAGKTTLARTLLGKDIGEVRDAAHVTDLASGHVLVQADGDTLMLWDTPGFGDTARLLDRLRMSGNPVGWLLTQVWDRWRERPLWSSQQAVKNARDQADVILYLVNAAEDPAAAAYVALEMEVLAWIGKPVLILLNQMGSPKEDTGGEVEKWLNHVSAHAEVAGALPLDAFARCWVQEGVLLDRVAPLLGEDKRPAMERLEARWGELNRERFAASMAALATPLAAALVDSEKVEGGGWRDGLAKALTGGKNDARAATKAMEALSERLAAGTRESTERLIHLHNLSGSATRKVLERLSEDFRHSDKAPEGISTLLGGILSGAATGVAADVMAGGLTLGGGMIVGGVLGAIGAGGLAKGINLARGEDGAHVRWSKDFFARILGASLLRYLAVAHFGRGRGDWEEGEHPEYWIAHVEGVLTRYETEIAALYAKGQSVGRDGAGKRAARAA